MSERSNRGVGGRRSVRKVCSFLGVAAALWLGAMGCAAAAAPDDPCRFLKAADAAQILEVPAGELQYAGRSEMMPELCTVTVTGNIFKRLGFSVYRMASVAEAQREMERMKEGFAVLSPIEPIEGTGDAAFSAPDSRVNRLVVRKGEWLLDAMPMSSADQQLRLVRILLTNLP